jgi:hypothetical protein
VRFFPDPTRGGDLNFLLSRLQCIEIAVDSAFDLAGSDFFRVFQSKPGTNPDFQCRLSGAASAVLLGAIFEWGWTPLEADAHSRLRTSWFSDLKTIISDFN